MNNSEFIRLIKSYNSDVIIKEYYYKEKAKKLIKEEAYYINFQNNLHETLTNKLIASGFSIKQNSKDQFSWYSSNKKVELSFCIYKKVKICCLLCIENQHLYYINPYSNDFIPNIHTILNTLSLWKEEWTNIETHKLPRLRKQLQIGTTSIEAMTHNIISATGLPYHIKILNRDTLLMLKLSYRRSICIKLRPEMDIEKLSNIIPLLKEIEEIFNRINQQNVTIINYGKNIKWEKADTQ